jgi:hypothetical protein
MLIGVAKLSVLFVPKQLSLVYIFMAHYISSFVIYPYIGCLCIYAVVSRVTFLQEIFQ